jgi:tetratricopeptide (TPR) repeat protein/TolB-like protein
MSQRAGLILLFLVFLTITCSRRERDTHYTVTYGDEHGVEKQRSVPREEHRTRIALFPLQPEPQFSEGEWLSYGFPLLLWLDFQQNIYVNAFEPALIDWQVRKRGLGGGRPMEDTVCREVAEAVGAQYFLAGSFGSDGLGVDLDVRLVDVARGRQIGTLRRFWPRFFGAADSVSRWVSESLPMDPRGREQEDRTVAEMATRSEEAMRLLSEGWWGHAREADVAEVVTILEEAQVADSTSAFTSLMLYRAGRGELSHDARRQTIARAKRYAGRLPEPLRLAVEALFLHPDERERAVRSVTLLTDVHSSEPLAHETAAYVFLAWGQQGRAVTHLGRAVALSPWRGRLFELMIGLYRESGRHPEAGELCRARVRQFPSDADAHFLLGHVHGLSADHDSALVEYEAALVLQPDHFRASQSLGLTHYRMGSLEEAIRHLDRALSISEPSARADVYQETARVYFRRGRVAKALETLEEGRAELVSREPLLAGRLDIQAGRYLQELGNYTFALERFGRSPLRREISLAWLPELARAEVFAETGREDEARRIVEITRAAIEDPGLEQAVLEMTVLGAIALSEERYTDAIEHFDFVEALDPGREDNLLRLGEAYRKSGDPSTADSVLALAMTLVPGDPRIHFERALVLESLGRFENARNHLSEAVRLWEGADPGIPHIEAARARLQRVQSES